MKFIPGAGTVRSLIVDTSKQAEIVRAFVEIAGAKPVKLPQRAPIGRS
jgi:hypothetical protein